LEKQTYSKRLNTQSLIVFAAGLGIKIKAAKDKGHSTKGLFNLFA
jgi:hypothetical protein